ncbi:MAG: efflux RND transporter permease subunit, partial [Myxococcales bacterium]|nr:efflux RND transporter permease subunit [Myxococcales bacterium]
MTGSVTLRKAMASDLLSQVRAQETALRTIDWALESGRVHHAYLFVGPDGVGKELAAFGLAQALVCERRGGDAGPGLFGAAEKPPVRACGTCSACSRAVPREDTRRSHHPDVVVLERGLYTAQQIGRTTEEKQDISIHQVRTLVLARAAFAPHEGRAKVFIIRRAEELKDALEGLGNVREVKLSGSRKEQLEVRIDLLRLEAYGLTAGQLLDALSRNNMVVPGGTLNTGQGAFNIEVPGLISNADDVYNLPIKTDGNTVVTFGDVATITRTLADATEYTHVNGSPAQILGVSKKLGTNIIDVSNQVRATTEALAKTWPGGVSYSFFLDQAETTTSLFRSLEAAVLTAVALVLITCIATLGVRPALMIGLSIPLSFMMAFLVAEMLGMTINMMVMFGLVIAVGVLVDDPVVVVEYAERKLMEGIPKREAFIMAMRKMFVPVVGATATTLGAFIPLLFWPGIIGKFMSYLPTIVIVVMIASFISALIFMPVIGSVIASTHVDPHEKAKADIVMYPDKFDTSVFESSI